MGEETLRMERVTYREQGVTLLENFSMMIWEGEIMGLVPMNHYGLPALIKLLKQNLPLHYGYIYYHENLVNHWRSEAAGFNRISVIQNESCLIEGLTVADNIFVLRPGFRKCLVQPDILREQLEPFIKDIGIEISADVHVKTLSPLEHFIVELLKAVVAGNRLIVLDDISGFICAADIGKIHRILKHYAEKGISFLYIASHLEETRQICGRTALMINGQITKCFLPYAVNLDMLSLQDTKSFEKNFRKQIAKPPVTTGSSEVVFQTVDLCCKGNEKLNICVDCGECLVLQDLDNSVSTGLLQTLLGEKKAREGKIWVDGTLFTDKSDRRIAVVQELAAQSMLFPNMSYLDNLCFTLDHRFADVWSKKKIKHSIRQEYALYLGQEVFDLTVGELTEKQKYDLVYTRIFLQNPNVVFCVQPFKGVEVSTRIRVWELLERFINKGTAVVIVAVNLADSLAFADRLMRVKHGAVIEEYTKEEFGELPVTRPWLFTTDASSL